MAWTKPKAREVKCGMEINMYSSAEDGCARSVKG